MTKKLALLLGFLSGFASICFSNEIRASDFANAFLQTTIMLVVVVVIMLIWNR